MVFVLSKIAWIVLRPSNALLILLVLGVVLAFTRSRRLGRALAALATAALLAVFLLPVHAWVLRPLEERFPQRLPAGRSMDGIVVLGGAIDTAASSGRDSVELNDNGERLTAFVALARRHPQARLVFAGGSGSLAADAVTSASVARRLLPALGLEADRVVFEDDARNTYESAVLTRRLVQPGPDETWLLITSARHMPRAVGAFRKAGWDVAAYPVDYRGATAPSFEQSFDLGTKLDELDDGVKEWIGLVAYRLLDRSDDVFPAPATR